MPPTRLLAAILVGFFLVGCVKSIAINAAAGALSGGGGTYSSDDDPELVREAIPFGLKTIESLLGEAPGNPKLLLAAASGFTQYGYAFVQQDAERLDEKDPDRSRQLYARARRLYARARGYGMRGLDAHHDGFTAALDKDRAAAVNVLSPGDVPLVYWTAAAWAAQISITKSDAMLLGDLPNVEALMGRALELDEGFGDGAIHEFYISYDGGRSESVGGSATRAKGHFDRALALTGGKKLGPYVSFAESVTVQAQDRKQFRELLERVLAFDADEAPQFRLVNLIAQDRARRLLARSDDLFAERGYPLPSGHQRCFPSSRVAAQPRIEGPVASLDTALPAPTREDGIHLSEADTPICGVR